MCQQNFAISFNYDAVLERLDAITGCNKLSLQYDAISLDQIKLGSIPLFKLHGSATWTIDSLGGQNDVSSIADLYRREGEVPGICAPGPSKSLAHRDQWARALNHIREADEIHFIGYRFPESDVLATSEILTAIHRGKNKSSIHIVLGPETNAPHIRRMLSLLENLKPACKVVAQARWAQDHLTKFAHGHV